MEKVIQKLNTIYNFDAQVRILGKVTKGYLTTNFIIGNKKEKYFLKQYIDGVGRVINNHRAKKFFAANDIPVVLPIRNKLGKTYFVSDKKVYALFPYVEGTQYEILQVSDKALANAARLLARIHLLSKDSLPVKVRPRKYFYTRQRAINNIEHIIRSIRKKQQTDFDRQATEHLKLKLSLINKRQIKFDVRKLGKRHIIHGDFHESNMFFQNNKVKYLFDWEMVSRAPRVMDLARSMDFFCFLGHYEKENFRKARIYLASYLKVYPMDREELSNGLYAWYYHKLHSWWSFKEYYLNNRKDAAPFIRNETRDFGCYSKKLDSIITQIVA